MTTESQIDKEINRVMDKCFRHGFKWGMAIGLSLVTLAFFMGGKLL